VVVAESLEQAAAMEVEARLGQKMVESLERTMALCWVSGPTPKQVTMQQERLASKRVTQAQTMWAEEHSRRVLYLATMVYLAAVLSHSAVVSLQV